MSAHKTPLLIHAAICFIVAAAALSVILFCCAGCAITGNRSKTADALDIYTPDGAGSQKLGLPAEPSQNTSAVSSHFRWRHTTTDAAPPTAKQRAAGIIGTGLGLGALALIAVAVLAPGALAAFALRTAAKWRTATRQIVRGLHDADTVARDEATHNALAASTDDRTKTLVAKIKNDA